MQSVINKHKDSTEKVFNYRLSRARGIVEDTFRLIASMFRIFRETILVKIKYS